ncbi:hypothetical protein B9Z55_027186 [Caenorhabditis nigoni]|uniref:3'-5' exonuclease domain-containing protein n=1 Tax=Caenorhabditis nigoni TaxID=1611254 RepID=A0A2G5SGI9_9PELO|nr:hypothetical protein B9Z55_027186 [Caenorhabditis nigoni]
MFLPLVEPILTGELSVNPEEVRELEEMRIHWPFHLCYSSFDRKRRGFYDIVVAEQTREGFEWLRHVSQYNGSLYCDTESIMGSNRLALITLCCIQSRSILLWRVHRLDSRRLAILKEEIERFIFRRRGVLVVFGPESFFSKESTDNIQPRGRNPPFLLNMAKDVGVILDKKETLSDWGARALRRDQIEYADMDALVLYALEGGWIEERRERRLPCKLFINNYSLKNLRSTKDHNFLHLQN